MAYLSTTLKAVSPFSPFVKKHNPNSNNNSALLAYYTPNPTSKQGRSVIHKEQMFVAVHGVPVLVESSWRLPMSDVVVVRKKSAFLERSWNSRDVRKLVRVVGVHLLSLLAPFHFNWSAFKLCLWLSLLIIGICITLSYHRNLSHRSFNLPKWLEYLFAYGGVLAFQCGGYENVNDLAREPFYRFLHRTFVLHLMAYALLLYLCGGMPFLVWGIGVATVARLHTTFLVNSVCHIWGTRAWNTPDFSRNNCYNFYRYTYMGIGWHNNHHAFQFSARHGLEWWQLDVTWYLIRFLEAIGLATNVKLPTEAQKKRMALI
ncbi:unnamed protein product [Brassica rapa subsp. narinosa]